MLVSSRNCGSIRGLCAFVVCLFLAGEFRNLPVALLAGRKRAPDFPLFPQDDFIPPARDLQFLGLHAELLWKPHRLAVSRSEYLCRRHLQPSSPCIYAKYSHFSSCWLRTSRHSLRHVSIAPHLALTSSQTKRNNHPPANHPLFSRPATPPRSAPQSRSSAGSRARPGFSGLLPQVPAPPAARSQ